LYVESRTEDFEDLLRWSSHPFGTFSRQGLTQLGSGSARVFAARGKGPWCRPSNQQHPSSVHWITAAQNSAFSSLAVAVTVASAHYAYPPRDGQAELAWVARYILRCFTCLKTVTHPTTRRAQRRATALIETNALPLH